MLVYTAVPRSKKRKKPKGVVARKAKLVSTGEYRPHWESYRRTETVRLPSLITNSVFVPPKPSIMDPVSLAKESPEVRAAIIAKSKRLAPQFNKGAVQYITDEQDLTVLGRKIR